MSLLFAHGSNDVGGILGTVCCAVIIEKEHARTRAGGFSLHFVKVFGSARLTRTLFKHAACDGERVRLPDWNSHDALLGSFDC